MVPHAQLLIDGGTTHTRLWVVAVKDGAVVHAARVAIGARDGVDAAGRARLGDEIARLCREAEARCVSLGLGMTACAAAGMIGSPQGLLDVPHVVAPVGVRELAEGARRVVLPDGRALLVVPGVRFGPEMCTTGDVTHGDLVRGEEVLCLGLHARGVLAPSGVLLNLGSHWKRLALDEAGRLAKSTSCLSGEFLAAVAHHTILAGALPGGLDGALDEDAVFAGASTAKAEGIGRALYCVRLLGLRGATPNNERTCRSFLVGAILGADLPLLLRDVPAEKPVLLVGWPELCAALSRLADRQGVVTRVIAQEEVEAAFRAGLRDVLAVRHAMENALPPG